MDVPRDQWMNHGEARVRFISSNSVRSWWRAIIAVRSFQPDIVYVNSFFDHLFSLIPQILVRLGVFGRASILLAPRGEFSPGALAVHRARKRVVLALFRFLGLGRRIMWHASAEAERDDILSVMGPRAKVVTRENDTDLPAAATDPPQRDEGTLRVVHVSRLSPKKGLDLLLTALRGVAAPVTLHVFGPVEDVRFADRCHRLAATLPEHVTVAFKGTLEPSLVRPTIAEYDLMALATRGENFGHVIAESLSVSCPVMCPDNTPWSAWLRQGGGVVIEPDTREQWSRAIDEFAALSPEDIVRRRRQAGTAYAAWHRTTTRQPHLFTLMKDIHEGR